MTQYTVVKRDRLDAVASQPRLPVFVTSPTWQMNGVNIFAMNLVRGLRALGYEASIVLTDPRRREPLELTRQDDIGFVELPVAETDSIVARWRALICFLDQHQPCVYIPNYDWHTSCVAPRLGGRVAIIGIVHSDDPRHYEHFARLGHTWNSVVAVSHRIGEQLAIDNPSVQTRLTVIPIGVSLPKRSRAPGNDDGPLRIVYSGLLKQFQKRILDVPKILEEASNRGVGLSMTFAGGGVDEQVLRAVCANLEGRAAVRFLGILERDRLFDELSKHDIFLMTSEFEGLPNALLEAMAHSVVPVVSAVRSGIPEVIRHGENGLVAPIGDIDAFAGHLQALDRDRKLLAEMATMARETVANGPFRVERMVDAYADAIECVATEAVAGGFDRPRGRILPPADLGPRWRHHIPTPLRMLLRRVRGLVSDG